MTEWIHANCIAINIRLYIYTHIQLAYPYVGRMYAYVDHVLNNYLYE